MGKSKKKLLIPIFIIILSQSFCARANQNHTQKQGTIVILNGASSAGKTTLGNALEKLLNESDPLHPYKFLQTGTFVANSFEHFYKNNKKEFQT